MTSINTGSSNRQDSGLDGEFTFFDRSQDIRTSSIFLFDQIFSPIEQSHKCSVTQMQCHTSAVSHLQCQTMTVSNNDSVTH